MQFYCMLCLQFMTRHKITSTSDDLLLSSYDYVLPQELIASRPISKRDESKLLVYERKSDRVTEIPFHRIGQFLPNPTTLVMNRSKVFPARLLGKKTTGGSAEVFLLSLQKNREGYYPVMIKCSGSKKVGDEYHFAELTATLQHIGSQGDFWVSFNTDNLPEKLNQVGILPIPPYIRDGVSDEQDRYQYQTVFAQELGSVAAPTAGLHFTHELLQDLEKQGVTLSSVTLHVGAGTFQPVKTENILDHKMHHELFSIDEINAAKIKSGFGHWVAVGTTSLRTLQSCCENGQFRAPKASQWTSTDIFLHPGKEVYGLQGLLTNFHLPKSSLIMLVSSLIGRKKTLELYEYAIERKYRFFSYGDAMLILL